MKVLQFIMKPRAKNFNPQINITHMEKVKKVLQGFVDENITSLLPTLLPLHCLSRSRKCLTYTSFYSVVQFLIICLVQRKIHDLFCRRCTFVVMKYHDDVTRCIFKKKCLHFDYITLIN